MQKWVVRIYGVVLGIAVLALVAFMIYIAWLRIDQLRNPEDLPDITEDPSNLNVLRQAREAERRADEAVASADLILNLLEGASVLVAVALGGAAIYGFTEIGSNSDKFDKKMEQFDAKMVRVDNKLDSFDTKMESVDLALHRLPEIQESLREFRQLKEDIVKSVSSIIRLMQAYQEFSHAQNYKMAYRYASELVNDPSTTKGDAGADSPFQENPIALYIAGWLEVHHISGKLDEGIEHLQRVMEMEEKWTTVRAAYGVALRRKALRTSDPGEQRRLYNDAKTELKVALAEYPSLTDFNRESFHGPLGGLYRDTNRIEDAIEEYEAALRVTPGSSYPTGNLASLYLQQATENDDSELLEKAFKFFDRTYTAAEIELRESPGNYFLLMDLAMSMMVLSQRDEQKVEKALEHVDEALDVDSSCQMLEVSLRGWQRLLSYSPDTKEWTRTRDHFKAAIASVGTLMIENGCEEAPPAD